MESVEIRTSGPDSAEQMFSDSEDTDVEQMFSDSEDKDVEQMFSDSEDTDVEQMFSDSEDTDVEQMFSDSVGNTTDPASASSVQEENSPTEKPKKMKKKKGICAFFRRIGKAIKLPSLGCSDVDVVSTFPSCDPTGVQQDLSGLDWASSVDPCPSGVELPVNADPSDSEPSSVSVESLLELMSVSDVSSLDLSPESDPDDPEPPSSVSSESLLELMSVSDISSLELPVHADPDDPEPSSVSASSVLELMSVSDVSSLDLPPESDPDDPEPASLSGSSVLDPESAPDLELMSVSGLSSLSSIELTPDSSQDDPDPSSVPGPSAPDSEIPDPSGLGTAFVFDLWFAENRTKTKKKKKAMGAFLRRKWSAMKRSVLDFQLSNKFASERFADEPVANQDPADLRPLPLSSPSTLDSGITPAVEKQTKRRVKKDIKAFIQRTWKTIKVSAHCCYGDDTVDPDPADLQPRISVLSWDLTDPGPSYFESTSGTLPFSGPSYFESTSGTLPFSGPSYFESTSGTLPFSGPSYFESTSGTLPFSGPSYFESTSGTLPVSSTQDPSLSGLVSELSSILGSSSHKVTPVPCSSSLKLADPEPKPVPGASGLWSTGAFSSFYEVKAVLGTGGFGTVCEGTRRCDGQKVAIKFRPKKCWDTFINLPGSTKPLLMEVAVNLLMRRPPRSPHMVQMLDWFDQPEQFVLIMEYPHPCETLLRFSLRNGGSLDEPVARGLMRQAVLAAKHCVDRGVFHKDIKTDNILVNTETLQLTFIDFGCCELFKTSKGREWAVKSTVWSLGRVLLEIASGSQPLHVLQFGKLDLLRPTLSKECCDLIKQCLDNYQSKRPALEQILEHAWFEQD
ncbi:hypothetical protein R3I93_008593 [Phoxinus phoxinus]|uniref:non-specific serine/threonine protein kinase n=1 Tax=Phoxinus phoxinus TaxID=58324 RepID=A0AAN9H9R4_9TELE